MLAVALVAAASPSPVRADDNLAAYVRARAAAADGRVEAAAAGYAAALAADPGNALIAIRAFREGVSAGDLPLARRALTVLERADVAPPDAALLRMADAIAAKDMPAARAAVDRIGQGPLAFVAPVLDAWIGFDRDADASIAALAAPSENALSRRYAAENRALMLIADRRFDEGVDALKVLLGEDDARFDLRIDAAQLLAGRGKTRLGEALLIGGDPVLEAEAAVLRRGPRADTSWGIARLLLRLAGDLNRDETAQLAVLLTRASLLLEPGSDRATLLLAEALSRDGATERALASLETIGEDGPVAARSRALRVAVLTRAGDPARALAIAETVAQDGDSATDAQNWGDLLVEQERFAEAADAYRLAVDRGAMGWIVQLQLGSALEQAGEWDAARPHLERAVALAPDQPVALNQLGYAQAERRENLDAAIAMLERARRLQPGDASITDSLGWAYFQQGALDRALPLLEQAARGDPGATTINEHLGDAYWRAGRRYEARYAWRAATVNAEGDAATRLDAKLATGLRAPAPTP